MKLRIDKRMIYFLFIILCLPFLVGFSNNDTRKFSVSYGHSEKTVECITNEDGILLLPLYDILDLIGYQHIECGRCGMDEIYKDNDNNEKGHLYVNWYKNVLTYSNDPTVDVLDSDNEKVDGITYTSSMLYTYIGYTVQIDTSAQTIEIQDASVFSAGSNSSAITASANSGENAGTIVYVYDPNCTGCKEITSLLDDFADDKDVKLYKIDASNKANEKEISSYEISNQVPEVIRGIDPIVFIGDQYLFNAEITEENLIQLLQGAAVNHTINYQDGTNSQTSAASSITSDTREATLIYFYSSTCASCKTAVDYINQLKSKYPDMNAVGFNLYIPENITLLKAYGKEYGLDSDQLGEIPAAFISDQALIGDKAMLAQLELLIKEYDNSMPTKVIDPQKLTMKNDILNGLAVFGAGLLNGINPCSLSMFLFLFSLIMLDDKKIIKIGLSFSLGKFIMFFLLGTIFYKVLSGIDTDLLNFITKDLMMIFVAAFAVLNIIDYIMAKKERYDKMILQLPSDLKQWNHNIMRRIAKYSSSKYLIVIMILLGMLLAFGEFMCTGQIYLTSILVLIQGSRIEWIAVLYLIIYSFAFILPLLIMTLLIYYGKKVFTLSEGLLTKLPMIKVISSILFILFGLYIVFR